MTALPPGLRIALDPGVRRWRFGVLTGGTPRRIVRLSPAGDDALRVLERGGDAGPAARTLAGRLVDAGIAHPRPVARTAPLDVTVVVPVRDRPAELDRCLASLDTGLPVVVVDDGSLAAETVAVVARRHQAVLVRRSASGGPAAARNTGVAHVDTGLVAFLDSDCVGTPGWLAELTGHLDDPLVAAVAPRVRPSVRPDGSALERYLASRSPLDMGPDEASVEPGGRVGYVPTAALVVRRDAIGAGFDEDLRYGEDVDLVWRLRAAGRRVRYDPRVTVWHHEPQTLRPMVARRFRYGTSAAPLCLRHPGALVPAVVSPWPAAAALLLLTGRVTPAVMVAGQQTTLLARRVARLGVPQQLALRWFGESMMHNAVGLGRYSATFALPVVAAVSARRRTAIPAAVVAAGLVHEWRRRPVPMDPLRWAALALVDDVAYGAGVWWGCLRGKSARALIPGVRISRSSPRADARDSRSNSSAPAFPGAASVARRSR